MPQRPKQQQTSSSSNLESAHEPKGAAGRPRNHGVPTETKRDTSWWDSQPTGFITTQLSNMGWRVPHFAHFTKQGAPAKRLSREHYVKELYLFVRRT